VIKKTLIGSVLVLLIMAFSVPASATTTSIPYLDDQVYCISGKMTVKVDIKNYIVLSVTIPNLANYEEIFIFFGDGTWMDQLLYTAATGDSSYTSGIDYPTWSQSGANFTVDLSSLADSIESSLGSYVNLSGGASKNPVITGKVSKTGISGKMALGWNMSTYVEGYGNIGGSLTIAMTYKGVDCGDVVYSSAGASENKTNLQNAVRDAIVSALSSLPKKAQEPAQ
jgi:hypothetical protein